MPTNDPAQPGHHVLDVTAANGTPLRVVAYAPGAPGPYPSTKDDAHALVEFYDRRYPHTEHGQFTGGRYRLATLLGNADGRGLNLYGGVDAWRVDADTMHLVGRWLTRLNLPLAASAPAGPPVNVVRCVQCQGPIKHPAGAPYECADCGRHVFVADGMKDGCHWEIHNGWLTSVETP